ncbi:MAG: histidine kinase [Saprospiraceae bacterium]
MKHLLLHIALLGCCLSCAWAQDYPYIQFTTADGLPTNYVYGVIEDLQGNIWAYTENGLAKYDGYSFQTLTVKDGLPGNDIVCAHADAQGRIWMQIYANRPAYLQHGRIFTPLDKPGVLSLNKGNIRIGYTNFFLQTDSENFIDTLLSVSYELIQFIPEAFTYQYSIARAGKSIRELEQYPLLPILTSDSLHYYKTDIRIIDERACILPTNNHEVQLLWKNHSEQWKQASIGQTDFLLPPAAFSAHALSDRYILVVKNLQQGIILDRATDSLTFLNFADLGVHPDVHHSVTVMKDYFWLSTDDGSVAFYYNGQMKEVIRITELSEKYLLHRTYKDRSGNWWIGSQEGGLFLVPFAHARTQKLLSPKHTDIHFEQLIPWDNQRVFGISAHAGVFEITPQGMQEWVSPNMKLRFRSALRYGDELWVSCNVDAFKLKRTATGWYKDKSSISTSITDSIEMFNNGHFYTLPNYPTSVPLGYNIIASALDESSSFFWGMASSHTFFKYDFIKRRIAYIHTALRNTQCLYYDEVRQVLLTGKWNGLYTWDEHQVKPFLAEHPTLKNITALYGTSTTLWIGTEGNGLFRYNYQQDSLYKVTEFGAIRNIRTGWNEQILVAGANGVLVIDGSNAAILHHLTTLDGLASNEIEDVALWDEDNILVAAPDGVYKINLRHAELPPLGDASLQITSFGVNNLLWDTSSWMKPLPHHQNNIRFNFHLQHIASRGQITYQTRLEPLEREWHSQNDRSIQYSGLQPGRYQFHLGATDLYGRTVTLRPFAFSIQPAWWQTVWFRALISLLFVTTLFYFTHRKLQQERYQLQQEKALNKRMAELELNALRAQMNPHFVFNALGAIQYYIQTHEVETADEYLTKFAALMRKYLESSREQLIPLEQELTLLQHYTDLEMMRFEGVFRTHIQASKAVKQKNAYIPSMLIQPFVENAINHGLCERRDSKGQLSIIFDTHGTNLRCVIEDNGIGRKNAGKRLQKTPVSSHAHRERESGNTETVGVGVYRYTSNRFVPRST